MEAGQNISLKAAKPTSYEVGTPIDSPEEHARLVRVLHERPDELERLATEVSNDNNQRPTGQRTLAGDHAAFYKRRPDALRRDVNRLREEAN